MQWYALTVLLLARFLSNLCTNFHLSIIKATVQFKTLINWKISTPIWFARICQRLNVLLLHRKLRFPSELETYISLSEIKMFIAPCRHSANFVTIENSIDLPTMKNHTCQWLFLLELFRFLPQYSEFWIWLQLFRFLLFSYCHIL